MRYKVFGEPPSRDPLAVLLTQNFVTGCTVLVNRPLLERALPIPESAVVHDWWLALVAASCGHLLYVDWPTVAYRQHDSNAIGADVKLPPWDDVIVHPMRHLGHATGQCRSCARQLEALERRLEECGVAAGVVDRVHRVRRAIAYGGVKAIGRLLSQHIRQLGRLRTVAFYLLCMLKSADPES
jgi:hypothetical protein